jgi:hypothetical protein
MGQDKERILSILTHDASDPSALPFAGSHGFQWEIARQVSK